MPATPPSKPLTWDGVVIGGGPAGATISTRLARPLKSQQKSKRHNSAALFGHLTGAQRLPGRLPRTVQAWRQHRRKVRNLRALPGETVHSPR